MEAAVDQARLIMRSVRHDRPGAEDSFTIETTNALAGLLGTITGYFGAVAVAIAAISLVVGGIVIMNIMLVSVTERTREIGVRKALGARRNDLLKQFLMESGTMALVGGAIGVILGVVLAKTVTLLHRLPLHHRHVERLRRPLRRHLRRRLLRRLPRPQSRRPRSRSSRLRSEF